MSGLLKVLTKIRTLFVKNANYSQVEKPKKETTSMNSNTTKAYYTAGGVIHFKNSSQRLAEEFVLLDTKNPELYQLLVDTCAYCRIKFDKDITVTMIYRTQEEQDVLYKDNEKYKQKKFTSPHQYYHAVDLRSSAFSKDEINTLVDYLNKLYNKSNYYKFTALNHDIGAGDHLHLQYLKG